MGDVRVVTMCGHGERAVSGASVLERRGHSGSVLAAGPHDWEQATGRALSTEQPG